MVSLRALVRAGLAARIGALVDTLSPDPSSGTPLKSSSPWRAAIAGGLGTVIEYYDFQLYGVMAVVLSSVFFSKLDPNTAVLATLATFGGAFFARPIGGILFGWLGDRRGRTFTLIITVAGIGLASAVIGVLPGYGVMGIAAPGLLITCRLLQGFFAGGEITGASTYIAETAPAHRRGFFVAFNPAAATIGLSLASLIAVVTEVSVGNSAYLQWAWRIPFLVAIPLLLVTLWARRRVAESPRFAEIVTEKKDARAPLVTVVRNHWRSLLQVICIGFAQNAAGYVGAVYLSTYLVNTLKYPSASVLWMVTIVTTVGALAMPFVGQWSDRRGRKPILLAGFLAYLVLVPLCDWVATLQNFPLLVVGVTVSFIPFVLVQSVGYPLYTELFPTQTRYSGVSLGFNIATILGGATAPFVAKWLTDVTRNPIAPAGYVVFAVVIGIVALLTVKETAHRDLSNS